MEEISPGEGQRLAEVYERALGVDGNRWFSALHVGLPVPGGCERPRALRCQECPFGLSFDSLHDLMGL